MGACAALLLGASLAAAQGLDTNHTTIITFSAPVALPGVTLPAGSYMFKLADSQANRNIVQVFDKDRTKIFATILAVSAQRNRPADDTVITFKEAPASAAPAVQYWFYPGETIGQEFAYPKKQAQEIANASHTSVLSVDMDNDKYDATKGGEMSRVEPGAEAAQTPAATAPAARPENQPSETPAPMPSAQSSAQTPSAKPESQTPAAAPSAPANQPVGTSGSTSADMPAGHAAHGVGTSGKLPHTASPVPMIGFAGLLALLGAAGVRAVRKADV
jgi:hypothetical protein